MDGLVRVPRLEPEHVSVRAPRGRIGEGEARLVDPVDPELMSRGEHDEPGVAAGAEGDL